MNKTIEDIDREIIGLISRRTELFVEDLKKRGGKPSDVFSAGNISEIAANVKAANKGQIPDQLFVKIFNEIISASVKIASPLRVAYLGPVGTFSHLALLEIYGSSVTAVPQNTIKDVFLDVETDRVSLGVVPIENSTEGAVTYTLDAMLDSDIKIISEKNIKISINLLSKANDVSQIKKIYSHPQPLAQSKGWLHSNFPNVEIVQMSSTTTAAEIAAKDTQSAAVAPIAVAELYSMNILASNIEDSPNNYTRFFVIGKDECKPTGNDKTSIICGVPDKPGALYSILHYIKKSGINMTKIESRPDKTKMWAYNFFIDLRGHKDDAVMKKTLKKLKQATIFLKILGSYPAEN